MKFQIQNSSKSEFCNPFSNTVFYLFSFLFCLTYFFMGCQKTSERPAVKREIKVIAMVNGEKITVDEFEQEFSVLRKKKGIDEIGEEGQLKTLRKNLLNQLIEKKLLLQEARRLDLSVKDGELDDEMKKMIAGYPSDVFQEMLHTKGMNREDWREKVKENMLIGKLIDRKLKGNIHVSNNDIDSYFKSHFKNFSKPLQFHIVQIVVKSQEDAISIRSELLKGGDFEKIAREKSIGPEAEKGGDLGFFSEGQMPQEFDDVILKLKVGDISYPLKTPYGYHIFKLVERREPGKMEYGEAKEKIRNILMKERYDNAFKNMMVSLKDSAKIEIKDSL
ncbi:MAG: peptidylprolyl isomerase [Nitrospinota bacterium]